MKIEKHQEMGGECLLNDDKYLMEIKLDDLEHSHSSGEHEEYWLLAIRATRNAYVLCNQNIIETATTELE